ncbi:Hsp70 family protein [Shewanella algae]|uniref:Hsp70 family protein n=1 Tax=Shewanella algae TaxID=38313 RepID=UPI001AAD5DAF|nr:molecular chaperone HscC [Shewanella algae]MBO2578019.1 molecular chaperone HscC [Shewanella algae]MBO2683527.1 molecular chaperone HscC [Shewanella algae]BCV61255.1 chaperone protein HscC [Shewanella algae]
MDKPEVPAIGIDLGTTNSAIALWCDGKVQMIPNALGEDLTPSVVSIDEGMHLLVGRPAAERLMTHPRNTAAIFKRFLGSEKRYRLGGQEFSPTELCAIILSTLKADAEAYLGHAIKQVVISVPAYFNDQQRKQVHTAAELAELEAVRLINEPTAAAMAYSLHESHSRRFLVFDIGGGTFDVTIVEFQDGIIEVRASAGDNRLGGEDFTQDLLDGVLQKLQLERESQSLKYLSQLYYACENAKRHSNGQGTRVCLSGEQDINLEFDGHELEKIWQQTLNRLRKPLSQALADARLQPEEIDELILVGGASRQHHVKQVATRLLGRFGRQELDPDRVVAMGAAIQAACRLRDEAVEELILTDVCPFSLGIRVESNGQSGVFSPIIERNTVVPVSLEQRYYAGHEEQSQVCIAIYQGESLWVANNLHIDDLDIDIPTGQGLQSVDVRFSYDINGMLEVDVTITSTGEVHQKVIDRSPTGVSEDDRQASRQRLARLKVHPREQLPNLNLTAKLHRMYEECLGGERRQIEHWLLSFEQALASQDEHYIRDVRQAIQNALAHWDQ